MQLDSGAFMGGGFTQAAPYEHNIFGLRVTLRDPVEITQLPTSGPGQRILISNASRVGLRIKNTGVVDIFLSTEPQDIFAKNWRLPPDQALDFPPPWAPIDELFAGAQSNPCSLRVWELHAD